MWLIKKMAIFEQPAKFILEKSLSLLVTIIEIFVPDKLLLLLMNILDKRVPPKTIDIVIDEVDKYVSPKVRSTLLAAADELVPDTVANSRKLTTVIAGVGKYVPDRIIPSESAEEWSNLKVKFHIPTLLSREVKGKPPPN